MKPHEYKFVSLHDIEEVDKALDLIEPVGEEQVNTWDALNRVLSRDAVVPMDIPPRAKAAYDGYAVRSDDVTKTPVRLRVVGSVSVGSLPNFAVGPGEAAYVTTGAYLPDGADAVVPEEYVEVVGDEVVIHRGVGKWDNTDPPGSFAKGGEVALRLGTLIMPWDIPALLELGIGSLWVRRKIRIYIVATGSELIIPRSPEDVLNAVLNGKVVESTASMITQFISMYTPYAEVVGKTIVPDDYSMIRDAVVRGLEVADVVITTGGTGPSGVDYVFDVMTSLKPLIYIRGLKMRPGRPTGIAVLGGNKVVLNFSGHPISTLNALTTIFLKVVKKMAGLRVGLPEPRVNAKLVRGSLGEEGIARQYRVKVVRRGNEYLMEAIPRQGSSLTHTLLQVNGLVFTRAGMKVREGDEVEVFLLREPESVE
ncbi:molybdopterin molybdotransferase MoeA [Vulcanisaeta thermophila]|uniref:molybdopterin molybdotransferase MoeA n=1 Tax=Vulcanisaeta thermophila TaxID=867917 RepID=UPI0008529224|nr:molybdopterin molybdotransferase MoeA [Vulcanisaeta thermophila]